MNAVDARAVLSEDLRYRYMLSRAWDPSTYPLVFIMLNPSTADAEQDDPTIRRCMSFAKRERFGGIVVANLYAFRATVPSVLRRTIDPVGPKNDQYLAELAEINRSAGLPVVVAWGAWKSDDRRVEKVRAIFEGVPLVCLGATKCPVCKGTSNMPTKFPADVLRAFIAGIGVGALGMFVACLIAVVCR